jgi:hypothetical protein
MSTTYRCDDKDTLIAYLYNEIDPGLRQQVDEHLRTCAACAAEAGALAGVREGLGAWAPPEKAFGFTIVPTGDADAGAARAEVAPPPGGWATVPVWAQAAAAVLVLAVGVSVANIQVRSGPDGLVITTGWMAPAAGPGVTSASAAPATEADWKPALAALEASLRQELRARGEAAPAASSRASAPVADEATIRRVARALIDESEAQQRRELALRLTQFGRDLEVQRQADFVRIERGIGRVEGMAGAEIARQRQMVNYLMRVSQPQQ